MKRFNLAWLVVAVTAGAQAHAQDANSVLRDAEGAIAADVVKTLQYTATGYDYAIGQQARTDLPWPKFIEKKFTRSIDFEVPISRIERVRAQGENPLRGGGGQPIVGEQTQTQIALGTPQAPWAQQAEILVTPHGFIRAAAGRPLTLSTRKVSGKPLRALGFQAANGARITAFINSENLIERVETVLDSPVLGDVRYESIYTDYRSADGTRFPYHIVQKQGGFPVYDLSVTSVQVNAPVSIAPPAPQAAAATAPGEPQKLGDGVYLLAGNYAVIAVEFEDHVVLLESGQSDERAAQVIADARRLIPGKPIRYVVNTHPHFDHSSGLRAFAAEGITILTHRDNVAYLRKALASPRTLGPHGAVTAPKVEGVADRKVLTDGKRVVELHRLRNFAHHDAMLVAWFPREKVLFEADAYNPQAANATPPNPASPVNVSLLENIARLKLDVTRIVPVHRPNDDRVVTLDELRRWIGPAAVAQR